METRFLLYSPIIQTISRNRHPVWFLLRKALLLSVSLLATPDILKSDVSVLPDQTDQVIRIFNVRCTKCHGTVDAKANLNLTSLKTLFQGSESGPVIDIDDRAASLLLSRVEKQQMPPEGQPPLSAAERSLIRTWTLNTPFEQHTFRNEDKPISQWEVLPILQLRCTVCHGTRRREGDLDLRTRESMLRGGKTGPAIVPGQPEKSRVLERIHSKEMPPRRQLVNVSIKPPQEEEIAIIREWILQGAPDDAPARDISSHPKSADKPSLWSFQPPSRSPLPNLSSHAVDAFLLEKLKMNNLDFSPRADRATLIRRAYLDLTGLPPSPEEIQSFLDDNHPEAFEKLIDRLLASTQYGERWAGYWLDMAGYADSEGIQESDSIRPAAYRYRDYVIRSLNADKPYDRFLMEQIAGDDLAPYSKDLEISQETYDNLVATGFLRMATDGTYVNITGFVPDRLDVINDSVEIFSSAILGLTLKCARCHDHKFDPLTQRDYYRMTALFKGAFDEHDWLRPVRQKGDPGIQDRYLPHVSTPERTQWEEKTNEINQHIEAINTAIEREQKKRLQQLIQKRLQQLPSSIRDDVARMIRTPKDQRDNVLQYLAVKFESRIRVTLDQLLEEDSTFKSFKESQDKKREAWENKRPAEPLIRALWDRGSPSPTYLLKRGNYLTPGQPVTPGIPAVLANTRHPFQIIKPSAPSTSTGRRMALASWLTRRNHPLTARVVVNRIWKHHFEQGIVSTLDNFGQTGARPTHPELLDWLACELMDNAWSMKHIHRLIMTSFAYQQSSQVDPERSRKDPENKFLSFMPMKRLDAEALRDSLLDIAGLLNRVPFGPPDPVSTRKDGLVSSNPINGQWRRSIYLLHRRTTMPTLLMTFDRPRMSPNCIERTASTVAPQALHLFNNTLVHQWAKGFAKRVLRNASEKTDDRIHYAYLLAAGRAPLAREFDLASQYLEAFQTAWSDSPTSDKDNGSSEMQGWVNLCHALLNSASFLYID